MKQPILKRNWKKQALKLRLNSMLCLTTTGKVSILYSLPLFVLIFGRSLELLKHLTKIT